MMRLSYLRSCAGRRHASSAACLALAVLVPLLGGCRNETPARIVQFEAFDSPISLSIVAATEDEAARASAVVAADMAFLERAWVAWRPGPLARVNELLAEGEPFAAPPSLLPLLRKGQRLSEQSGGLFNPALGNLVRVWGFDRAETMGPPPAASDIERIIQARPSMDQIYIDGISVASDNPAVRLDFGDLAKGLAMDRVMEHLREVGVANALIKVGNDVRTIGDRDGRAWRVTIPSPGGSGVVGTMDVTGDEAVFTVGAYEHNFVYRGRTYHAILDPRTGYPAQGVRAVTVAHADAATAYAAATALFIAGPTQWPAVAERMGIARVLLIDLDGTLHMSPAMAEHLQLMKGEHKIAVAGASGDG